MTLPQSTVCRRIAAGVLVVCFLAADSPAQSSRDWQRFPAIVEAPMPAELFALGDVHGDYDRTIELLAAAHLIASHPAAPRSVEWTGGASVLVCTGDMIDKYDHGMNVIAMMRVLEPLAAQAGGRVIVTMGNHEAEFLAGAGADQKNAEFEHELDAAGIPPADVAAGKDAMGIGRWLRDLPVGAKVGDWFFCHAGNTGRLSISQLDERVQTQVTQHGFDSPILTDPNSILEARLHPRPWWDWDGQAPALKDASTENQTHSSKNAGIDPGENRLRAGIEALGAHHLVFGHQPGKVKFADGSEREAGVIYEKFDGLIFLIDTGMSRGVSSGRGALLHISNASVHGASAVYADGTVQRLVQ